MRPLLFIYIALTFIACGHKRIEITPDYIINENWNEQAKAIKISRMKLKKDSILNLHNLNQINIVGKLEEDSSFIWYANVEMKPDNSFKEKKIYFNKDNGFDWGSEDPGIKTRTIGNLEKGNWYKFSRLVTFPYDVYVFVDSQNNIHQQDVNLANY